MLPSIPQNKRSRRSLILKILAQCLKRTSSNPQTAPSYLILLKHTAKFPQLNIKFCNPCQKLTVQHPKYPQHDVKINAQCQNKRSVSNVKHSGEQFLHSRCQKKHSRCQEKRSVSNVKHSVEQVLHTKSGFKNPLNEITHSKCLNLHSPSKVALFHPRKKHSLFRVFQSPNQIVTILPQSINTLNQINSSLSRR